MMTPNEKLSRIKKLRKCVSGLNYDTPNGLPNLFHFSTNIYGSQNYELDDENSDIDAKIIVLPLPKQLLLGHPFINMTYHNQYGGKCEVKDIRDIFNNIWKQNINFLEILFTDFYIVNALFVDYYERIWELREDIAHYDELAAVRCMRGIAESCAKKGIKEDIYDGKALSRVLQMEEFMCQYIDGVPFKDCLTNFPLYGVDTLREMKKGFFSREEALDMIGSSMVYINKVYEDFKNELHIVNSKVKEEVEGILVSMLEKYIKYRAVL